MSWTSLKIFNQWRHSFIDGSENILERNKLKKTNHIMFDISLFRCFKSKKKPTIISWSFGWEVKKDQRAQQLLQYNLQQKMIDFLITFTYVLHTIGKKTEWQIRLHYSLMETLKLGKSFSILLQNIFQVWGNVN